MYEQTNVDSNQLNPSSLGTAYSAINHNRNSSNTSVCSLYDGPLLVNTGDLIDYHQFGAGQNIGGESRGTHEYILKPGVSYAIILTSNANSNACLLEAIWYEHSDKE